MAVVVIDVIKPKNNGSWAVAEGVDVDIVDSGGYYTASRLEAILQEIGPQLGGGSAGTAQSLVVGEALTALGTSHTLANTPTSDATVALYLNGQRIEKVSASPTQTQYTISGATVTTGHSMVAADHFVADYVKTGTQTVVLGEDITTTGTTHTLANTPATEVALFLNGARLEKVGASPTFTQYTISGATITSGRSIVAADDFKADYIY